MKNTRKAAFTLVEAVVTLAVASILGAGVMTFYIDSLRAGYVTQQQIALLGTMHSVTAELISNGSRAHEVILYNTASASDRADVTDRKEISVDADVHPTGDFAVFVYYELPKPAANPRFRIQRLIGYYTETVDTGPPKLTRIIIDLSAAPSTETVEAILAANWTSAATGATVTRKTFAPRVTPLAVSEDYESETGAPQLFFKATPENLAVCGQLFQSAANIDTQNRNTHTRTFFFTISVRS
jgi:type II secretory pathway pseudopilin PulG